MTWTRLLLILGAAALPAIVILIIAAIRLAKDSDRAHRHETTHEQKRKAWGDADVVRFPPMDRPAAKGLTRDPVVGKDQQSRVARMNGH